MLYRLRKWIKRDPPRAFFTFFVIGAHLSLLGYLTFFFTPKVKNTQKSLVIKTMTAKPIASSPREKSVKAASSSPSFPKAKKVEAKAPPPAPAKKAIAPPAKKAPPIADKQLDKSNKKPPPKKSIPENREKLTHKLLNDLEESIAKIDEKPDKRSSSRKLELPSKLAPVQLDGAEERGSGEGEYQATLIGYLKESLHLPDYGEVKVQLTLRADGSVVNLLVIKTESEKNREYLELHLPHLRFPPVEGIKKQKTYVVTFCNEL